MYEWTPNQIALVSTLPGLLVSTNHFVSSVWNFIKRQKNVWFTLTRRKNLLRLVKKHAVATPLQLIDMQKILQRRLMMRGATKRNTIYQIIAMPKQRLIWLRVPGIQNDWQSINLNQYFEH